MKARPMPVLPLVGSTRVVCWGRCGVRDDSRVTQVVSQHRAPGKDWNIAELCWWHATTGRQNLVHADLVVLRK